MISYITDTASIFYTNGLSLLKKNRVKVQYFQCETLVSIMIMDIYAQIFYAKTSMQIVLHLINFQV